MRKRLTRSGIALVLVFTLIAGGLVAARGYQKITRTMVTAYFDNSTGIFPGDEVRILGMPVGEIDTIEPQPTQVKITFWIDDTYKVPADAKAVIVSPSLVTARAIQLVPAYTQGPTMQAGAVIPLARTAVPVEWDDLREQLEKLTDTLQPEEPGGQSSLGGFVNTAADNLRGQGGDIRRSVIELSDAISALGDHSGDLFGTIKNLSTLTTGLQSSTDLMRQLNQNLAGTTALLANDPDEVGRALSNLDVAISDVRTFVADNQDAVGTSSEKLASLSDAVVQSLPDIKQVLHVLPTVQSNFINIYQPAQSTLSGALALNNFSNPLMLICSAVQAASRLGAEQASKLCVQYLAPIVKNRQMNFPPLGANPFVGTSARPNELTYSEEWLRPANGAQSPTPPPPALSPELPVTPPISTDPAAGLPGLMMPGSGG